MNTWPTPPEDTPEIRDCLHQAFSGTEGQSYILELIERGADPFKCNDDGFNAFALARKHGYPESFCAQMEEVFSRWLRPLNATTSIYITQDADSFIDTLEEQGWQVWCKSTGQLGAFVWSSEFRLYFKQRQLAARVFQCYDTTQVTVQLPEESKVSLCHLFLHYGIHWSNESGEE